MSKCAEFAAIVVAASALVALVSISGVAAQGRLVNPRPVTIDREVSIYSEGVDVCGVYQAEAQTLYANARRAAVTMQIGGLYSFLYQVSTPYGGGPLSALIDPTGTGRSFPLQATVQTNVAGTAGILTSPPQNGQFPYKANITVQLPAQMNCIGSDGLCLMIIANGQGVGSCIFLRLTAGFNSGYNGGQQNQQYNNGQNLNSNNYDGASGSNGYNGATEYQNQQYNNGQGTVDYYNSGYNEYNSGSQGRMRSKSLAQLQKDFEDQKKRVSNLLYYRYDPTDIEPQIMSLLVAYEAIPEHLRDPILPYSQLRLTATQVLQLAKLIPHNLIPRELYAEARRVLKKYLADKKAAQAKAASPVKISNLASTGIRALSL